MLKRINFFVLIMLIFVASCGKSKKKSDLAALGSGEQNYYIKGELSSLYEGASLNQESFFRASNLKNFNDFVSVGHQFFSKVGVRQQEPTEYTKLSDDEKKKLRQKGQESSHENIEAESQVLFKFRADGNDWIYSDKKENLSIHFKSVASRIEPYKMTTKTGVNGDLEVLHYSIDHEDVRKSTKFSILAKVFLGQDELLVSFTFSKKSDTPIIELSANSQDFHYLLGPTKRAILVRGSEFSLCGIDIAWMREEFQRAYETWNKYLPKNYIEFNITNTYPPFSDVNTKCIYLIKDFAFSDPEGKNVTAGFVMPRYNVGSREIIDTDMIIGESEWESIFAARKYGELNDIKKKNEAKAKNDFFNTALHEMGHMLGLDHAFDDDHDHDSIMSYRVDKKLTSYDIASIRELYAPFYKEDSRIKEDDKSSN